MKYFIGIEIPKIYKTKIEMLRAEFKFFTTEPHITLIPPPALPDDDFFIKQVIDICKEIPSLKINLGNIGQFGKRVLYVSVDSPDLINLNNKIYDNLNLEKEKREYTPHLTIAKERRGKPIDFDEIKKRAEIKLIPAPLYTINSIVVYHQPKERSIYVPYMKIPLHQEER